MNEIIVETVVALLMFVNAEIKEHRIQDNMALCLRRKREAERTYSPSVTYKCLKSKAEIEIYMNEKHIKKIILARVAYLEILFYLSNPRSPTK